VTTLLKPLELLWRGVNRMRRALFRAGILTSKRLPRPVISVGNLIAGGSGKTPAVIAIARYLIGRGFSVAISRAATDGQATKLASLRPLTPPVSAMNQCSLNVHSMVHT